MVHSSRSPNPDTNHGRTSYGYILLWPLLVYSFKPASNSKQSLETGTLSGTPKLHIPLKPVVTKFARYPSLILLSFTYGRIVLVPSCEIERNTIASATKLFGEIKDPSPLDSKKPDANIYAIRKMPNNSNEALVRLYSTIK